MTRQISLGSLALTATAFGFALLFVVTGHVLQGVGVAVIVSAGHLGGRMRTSRDAHAEDKPESSNDRECRRLRWATAIEGALFLAFTGLGVGILLSGAPRGIAFVLLGLPLGFLSVRTYQVLRTVKRVLQASRVGSEYDMLAVTGRRVGWHGLLRAPLVLGANGEVLTAYAARFGQPDVLGSCAISQVTVELLEVQLKSVTVDIRSPAMAVEMTAIDGHSWSALSERLTDRSA